MEKLLAILSSLIMSAFLGVNYVAPEQKAFSYNSYYVGTKEKDPPDWKKMYGQYQGGSFESLTDCDKDPKTLSDGQYVYVPSGSNRFRWFWTISDNGDSLSQYLNDATLLDETEHLFKVSKGTKLVAPGEATLVSASQNSEGTYPETEETNGVYMKLLVKTETEVYRITYTSMERWWCCLDKTSPDELQDEDPNKPRYGHTVSFSDKEVFSTGAVVGQAGTTGIPKAQIDSSSSYVRVKLEASGIVDGVPDEQWAPVTFKEFFGR